MRFANKIAIVTGGGGEIGRATAKRLAHEGATVVVVDLNQKLAEQAAMEIVAAGGSALALQTDVSKRDQVQAMADEVLRRHGRIDVLCNIAGIAPPAPFLETPDENWDATLDVNLKGVFFCSQIVARAMVAGGVKGNIVNMASTNGHVGEVGLVAYNASKFGVVGLTMTSAIELAPHGIRVNAVAPGMIRTKLSKPCSTPIPNWHERISRTRFRWRGLANRMKLRLRSHFWLRMTPALSQVIRW